jgi:hypothetical protein
VARELLDDLSKDVIRNDRNLQLWLANAAANNLRAKLANEATPTPVYTFTPPTPSTDLSNAIRERRRLCLRGKRRERRSARSPMPEREGRLRHRLERHRRRRHRRRVPAANDDSRAPRRGSVVRECDTTISVTAPLRWRRYSTYRFRLICSLKFCHRSERIQLISHAGITIKVICYDLSFLFAY